jgi:hypothetical protein
MKLLSVIEEVILEQQSLNLKGKTLAPRYAPPKGFGKADISGDVHTMNAVLEIVTAFIPYVGPFISAGIGVADAKLYFDEGDNFSGSLALAFSIIPIVGVEVLKIPAVRKLGSRGMAKLAEKLKTKEPLTATETLAVNEIKQNSELINTTLSTASKRLGEVTQEVKTFKGPYIEKFGLDKYDRILSQFITGKIDKKTFIDTLKSGQIAWGPWTDFTINSGVKFSQWEINQIRNVVDELKSPVTQTISLDTYAGKNVTYAVKKYKSTDPYIISMERETAAAFADPWKKEIVLITDNIATLSDDDLINVLTHEIAHLKDPSIVKSPKFMQSFNALSLNYSDPVEYSKYVLHPFERIANTGMALETFVTATKNAQRTMSRQQMLAALDNIIQFSGGNVTTLSDDAQRLMFSDKPTGTVTDFYTQMSKDPLEYKNLWSKIRKQAIELKSTIKIAMN